MDHEQAVYNIRTYKMKKAYILKAGVSVNLYLLNTNSGVCLTQMCVTTTTIPGRDFKLFNTIQREIFPVSINSHYHPAYKHTRKNLANLIS